MSELSQVPEGLALLESGLGEIDGVGDRRGGAGVHVGGGDAHGGHEGGGGGGGGVSEGPGVERFSFRLLDQYHNKLIRTITKPQQRRINQYSMRLVQGWKINNLVNQKWMVTMHCGTCFY